MFWVEGKVWDFVISLMLKIEKHIFNFMSQVSHCILTIKIPFLFYRPLFEGDNDFCVCLKESFPNLKTRKLTRVEWGKIRRLMGKPRR